MEELTRNKKKKTTWKENLHCVRSESNINNAGL